MPLPSATSQPVTEAPLPSAVPSSSHSGRPTTEKTCTSVHSPRHLPSRLHCSSSPPASRRRTSTPPSPEVRSGVPNNNQKPTTALHSTHGERFPDNRPQQTLGFSNQISSTDHQTQPTTHHSQRRLVVPRSKGNATDLHLPPSTVPSPSEAASDPRINWPPSTATPKPLSSHRRSQAESQIHFS